MSEATSPTTHEHERTERHLRSVRTKLISARRNLQTLVRQSGMAQGRHRMENELARAEQIVRELEESESELLKLLGGDAETAPAPELEGATG